MIDREHRIPTLMPRSGGHPRTVVVCAQPDLAVLAKWDAMVAATPQSDVEGGRIALFDFGGLRAPTLQALLDGGARGGQPSVDRFKTSFGGTPYRYPVAVEMIHSPILRITYDLTRRWPAGRQLVARATRVARGRIGPRKVITMLRTRGRE